MANNSGDSWGGIIALVIAVLILGAIFSNPTPSQSTIPPNTQTWQQYAQSPSSEDVFVQLANSQNLIVALGNDVSRLQSQNVDIQKALAILNNQLLLAQQQAKEESKRQSRETWIATIVGSLIGWLLSIVAPPQPTLSKIWNFIKRPFTLKVNRKQDKKKVDDKSEIGLHEQKQDSVIPPRMEFRTNNPTSNQLCPKCGKPMVKQIATKGESKGKWFYVCPNYQECEEVFPVE